MELDVSNLKLEWFKKNINPLTLEKIMFCGNLGDPCMNKRLLEICQWLKAQNSEIVLGINTNGALQSEAWWKAMAHTLNGIYDYVVFSIDGTKNSNHIYREQVAWHRIMENATAFIEAGGSAHWDMLVFQHNFHEVDGCIKLARDMGFAWFRIKESSRWDIYPAGTAGLRPVDSSWQQSARIPIRCEANTDQSRYYDANGKMWPCCHMAEAHVMAGNEDIKKFSNEELLDNYNKQLKIAPYDICIKACGTMARRDQWRKEINLKEIINEYT